MTEEIIIDGYTIKDLKNLLSTGQRMSISTKTFEALIEELEHKNQECEKVKRQYNCYACDTCHGKEDYRNIKRHFENLLPTYHKKLEELEKYKNCLMEIKEYQKRNCETCSAYKTKGCNNSCQVFVILKRINEVENV